MGLTHNTVESNVFQRAVDYPDEFAIGLNVLLDIEVLVTVRWGQVEVLTAGTEDLIEHTV